MLGGCVVATVEVRRMMAGDPEKLYELIADVTRMGEWSPESAGCEWVHSRTGHRRIDVPRGQPAPVDEVEHDLLLGKYLAQHDRDDYVLSTKVGRLILDEATGACLDRRCW